MSDENKDDEDDPLESLYVDQSDIDRTRLAESIEGKIGIDQDSGSAVILSGYSELKPSEKIIAYLLYRRAAYELGHFEETELGLSGSDLSSETGVKEGTIKNNAHSDIYDNEASKGGYFIPSFAIVEAIEVLEDE